MNYETLANALILISSVIWFVHLIPQIAKTIKTKDVNGISVLFYTMSLVAYLLFIFGIALKQDWVVVFSQVPAYFCNVIMLALILKYRKKKPSIEEIPTPEAVEQMEEPQMLMLLYKLGYKILKEKK